MLYCGLSEVTEGMVVAAPVFHPRRADVELLAPGVVLDRTLLSRMASLGVTSLWVEHDLTGDLDNLINPTPSKPLQSALAQLKHDFAAMGQDTVSAGHVVAYKQIVMQLVCELIANRHLSGLTERLIGGPPSLFTHSANVAYLSVSVALDLEVYIIKQRRAMAIEHARDFTSLGIGAMLHDIGKAGIDDGVRETHEITERRLQPPQDPGALDLREEYRKHPWVGYRILRDTRAPASARQIVLNHHQRWDGKGFPDMSVATGARRQGTQAGEEIHIFNRIVSAANVLDNLMHDTGARPHGHADEDAPHTLPMVAALHRFNSAEFDGWFDPVVRDAMLRRFPPFAVGSRVILSDQRPAVVIAPSLEQPCRPTVRRLEASAERGADGEETKGEVLDLRKHRDLTIQRCGGVDVGQWLFDLPERSPLAVAAVMGKVA